MELHSVASETGEIVSLEEFKRELDLWDAADDARATLLLESARNYCEKYSERTLRLSATRTVAQRQWPDRWVLSYPPVLAVVGITYYDSDNVAQTLSTSNYKSFIDSSGFGYVEYDPDFQQPVLYDRQDAVSISYTVGYATAAEAPAAAKYAIILVGRMLNEPENVKAAEHAHKACHHLLTTVSAWNYA